MTKTITFAVAIVLVLAMWRSAEGTNTTPTVQLQTTFDFNSYRACGPAIKNNCIAAIRFYDAISGQTLATAATTSDMTGRQVIVATGHTETFPRRVYAVTVYFDDRGERMEGPRGQTSEYGAN
jgi:hypothetical protein